MACHRCQHNPSVIKAEPISQCKFLLNSIVQSQFWASLMLNDDTPKRDRLETKKYDYDVGPFSNVVGPKEPEDFGCVRKSFFEL